MFPERVAGDLLRVPILRDDVDDGHAPRAQLSKERRRIANHSRGALRSQREGGDGRVEMSAMQVHADGSGSLRVENQHVFPLPFLVRGSWSGIAGAPPHSDTATIGFSRTPMPSTSQ